MSEQRYTSPEALRRALTDRLRRLAQKMPGGQLHDLQRQFAYDRLLYRIFSHEPDAWVLKGATAMLARLGGSGRHTQDVDLYRPAAELTDADRALRECAAIDAGDWFRFTLGAGRVIQPQGARALRVPVSAYLGAAAFASFHVDIITDATMTSVPDVVGSLVAVDIPGIRRVPYRVYPVVDHIADKLCALVETHPGVTGQLVGSSRYRDLADIATFAHTVSVESAALTAAIRSEVRHRGLPLPDRITLPMFGDWRAGYARVARDVPGLAERDVDSALAVASRLLDPVLAGAAKGRWDPVRLRWV
jgi:hypothetical protein